MGRCCVIPPYQLLPSFLGKYKFKMFLGRKLFGEGGAVATTTPTNPATFNKYPPLKVKPFGVPGNTMMGIGLGVLVASVTLCQTEGWFLPKGTGLFFNTKELKIDLNEH